MADKFIFRALDTIGYPDALEDEEFLSTSFVDSGYLRVLRNCVRPERVVLGRTGAGKSALLERLLTEEGEERARRFLPDTLSLNYVSNSSLLSALDALGVNFELFFSLLWKHVFAVELIRWRYSITDENSQRNVFQEFVSRFKPTERKAFEYLQQFGDKFWIETDDRVVEFTRKFEDDLRAKIDVPKLLGLGASVEAGSKVSEEERREIRDRAQQIVNDVQLRYLSQIVALVKQVLSDKGRRWFIIIDRLDENWVDDRFKAGLIRALLDTVRSFREVQNLKIIVALRYDLIDRVFATARGSGAQREKYDGVFLHVRWNRTDLTKLLDRRINHLVRSRYSERDVVGFKDVFPREVVKRKSTIEWLLDRTLMRPRDVIAYVNLCIKNSDGRAQIPAETVRAVEGEYSRGRLDALFAEWDIDYPNLRFFVDLLKRKPSHFRVGDIDDIALLAIADVQLDKHASELSPKDDPLSIALRTFDLTSDAKAFRQTLLSIFYRVGIVGIKLSRASKYVFSHEGETSVSRSEIQDDTRVAIHETYWRVLAVNRPWSGDDVRQI